MGPRISEMWEAPVLNLFDERMVLSTIGFWWLSPGHWPHGDLRVEDWGNVQRPLDELRGPQKFRGLAHPEMKRSLTAFNSDFVCGHGDMDFFHDCYISKRPFIFQIAEYSCLKTSVQCHFLLQLWLLVVIVSKKTGCWSGFKFAVPLRKLPDINDAPGQYECHAGGSHCDRARWQGWKLVIEMVTEIGWSTSN